MQEVNYLAIIVAAVAAFVASFAWYMILGRQLATVSAAFAQSQGQNRQPWKMLFVLGEHLVIALIIAYLVTRMGITSLAAALLLGFLLWLGLSAMQWVSSIVYEKEPVKKAAIHAGDWLLKLILISLIVGIWH